MWIYAGGFGISMARQPFLMAKEYDPLLGV